MMWTPITLTGLALLGLTLGSCQSPPMNYANYGTFPEGMPPLSWESALSRTMHRIQHSQIKTGRGAYSTRPEAHAALRSCFVFAYGFGFASDGQPDLLYYPERLNPSYCSGAVYTAVLGALIEWDGSRPDFALTQDEWRALVPRSCEDGDRVWGWANANGPGYAVLVHELGAGYSFTSWAQARPLDIVKMWWTDEIGGLERGHLAILVENNADHIVIWGSHERNERGQEGIYLKKIPKSKIRRVLFTRITNPEKFAGSEGIEYNSWLNSLLRTRVSWEECLRRSGVY